MARKKKCLKRSGQRLRQSQKGFQDLPVELQLQIFGYFNPRQLSLLIAPVCKFWWKLSKEAVLWKRLTLKLDHAAAGKACCKILKCCYLLKYLEVEHSSYTLTPIIKCCGKFTHLRELCIFYCSNLRPKFCEILAAHCPKIEILTLRGCQPINGSKMCHIVTLKNLKSLDISYSENILTDTCMEMIAEKCQKLQLLNISGDSHVTEKGFETLFINLSGTLNHLFLICQLDDNSMSYLSACQKLISLHISCNELSDATLHSLSTISSLAKLSLFGRNSNFTDHAVHEFLSNIGRTFPNLVTLFIKSLEFDNSCLQNLSKSCSKLKLLSLCYCHEISDEGLSAVIDNCGSLIKLDISGSEKVTGESLNQLPSKLPKLIFLRLGYRSNVREEIVNNLLEEMPDLKIESMVF